MDRESLIKRFQSQLPGLRIVGNVGPKSQGRWSVEIATGCLGTVGTLLSAETLIMDAIARNEEEAENERQHEL